MSEATSPIPPVSQPEEKKPADPLNQTSNQPQPYQANATDPKPSNSVTNIFTNGATNVSKRIRAYFKQYPGSKAKECCRVLNLPYKKYGQMCRVEKCKLLKANGSTNVSSGEVGVTLPATHRWERVVELDGGVIACLERGAFRVGDEDGDCRPVGVWYHAPRVQNRMLVYSDEFVSCRVYPGKMSCYVLPAKPLTMADLRGCFTEALVAGGVNGNKAWLLAACLRDYSFERTFHVGHVPRFTIKIPELGATIKAADESHPEHIEVRARIPEFVQPLVDSLDLVKEELVRQRQGGLNTQQKVEALVEGQLVQTANVLKLTGALEKLAGALQSRIQGGEGERSETVGSVSTPLYTPKSTPMYKPESVEELVKPRLDERRFISPPAATGSICPRLHGILCLAVDPPAIPSCRILDYCMNPQVYPSCPYREGGRRL